MLFQKCGGRVNGQRGHITSPGYPQPLNTSVICDWFFRGAVGTRVVLNFTEMDLPTEHAQTGFCPTYLEFGELDQLGRKVIKKKVTVCFRFFLAFCLTGNLSVHGI